jgi:Protein of unknown function (DUF3631)
VTSAVERVLGALKSVRQTASGYEAFCPVHGDTKTRHLSIKEGDDGRALLYCHRCRASAEEVAEAIGLNLSDLFERRNGGKQRRKIAATYDYRGPDGDLLFQAVRYDPKDFSQRQPDANGGWKWNLQGIEPVPYRLPEVLEAIRSGEKIYLVEGEKDADRLVSYGFVATCNPMGAQKWQDSFSETLRGAHVVILPDADIPGRGHAEAVARSLQGKAASVRVLELPGLPWGDNSSLPEKHGPDMSDWLDDGHTAAELENLGQEAPEWKPEPEPNGADVLEDISARIRRYVVLSKEQAVLLALWTLHTHTLDAAEATPYLNIRSAEKRSGKTRLLEVLSLLAARPWFTGRVTAAVLVRKTSAEQPTLLLDESDAAFKGDREYAEALRGILNAGFRRGGVVSLCVGQGANLTYEDFIIFCPKAIAGIGKLPDTVADRSIPIDLKRRSPSEKVERFRLRTAGREALPIREAAAAWAEIHLEDLKGREPDLPEALDDRAQDIIEPLLAIADAVGGEWREKARTAATTLLTGEQREEAESVGIWLLRDVRHAFDAKGEDRLATGKLLERLREPDDAPWSSLRGEPLDANKLARLLKPYGIRPEKLREGSDTFRGYRRASFEDTWERYLSATPESPEQAEQPEHSANRAESDVPHNRDVPGHTPHPEHENPHNKGDVPCVPDVPGYPGTGEGDELLSSKSPPVADESDAGLTAEEIQDIEQLARSEVLADEGDPRT